MGRLNGHTGGGAWCPSQVITNNTFEWIQVTIILSHKIPQNPCQFRPQEATIQNNVWSAVLQDETRKFLHIETICMCFIIAQYFAVSSKDLM